MRRGLFIILFGVSPFLGFSQIEGLSIEESGNVIAPSSGINLTYLDKGSIGIYLDSTWTNTQIFYPNGSSKFLEAARFNILESKLEVVINEKPIDMYPGIIAGFSLENSKEINHLVLKVNLEEDVFVECLSAGKINLLVNRKLSSEVDTGEEISTKTFYFSAQEEKKLEYDETFYTQIPGNSLKRLKLSKKSLLKLMSDQEDEMESYIDENNLNPDRIQDLIQIFDYYNK